MRTYNGSLPYGKPKVLLICSDEDETLYGDEIAAEFFAAVDCSIWTVSDTVDISSDEIADLVESFQLVVCLLTSRFFVVENDWPAQILEEAKSHHIPLLPMLVEPCSERLYAQFFGDLQYLNRCYEDPTSIPYEEKLKKYLAATLVDEQTAEKIRSAFDAYVFLSYRKKDRKHAQELMRLIHRYPFCRDIAIWYDEFLTPGEDFNHAIEAALNKCDLFALAVTPNIVNEDNFIRRIEYPIAYSAQKPILPLEAVPTDRKLLEQYYINIPDCADPYDEKTLEAMLLQHIRTISLTGSSDCPEHLFFIGLAYLEGVDVETDHSKGVELITEAADAGLPEAMKRLSHMYETGYGVDRDYHTAAEWQKKLATLNAKEAKASKNEQIYDEAVTAALEYSRLLHLSGEDKEANIFLKDEWDYTYTPESLIGRIAEIRLNIGAAKAAYEDRSFWIAGLSADTGLSQAENLYMDVPSPETETVLADSLETYIIIDWEFNPGYQKDKIERLVSLRRKAMGKDPTQHNAWSLCNALNLLGRNYIHNRAYEEASSCLNEEQELLNAYSVSSMLPEYRMKYVTVLRNRGVVAASVGRNEEACIYLRSALKEAYEVAQDSDAYTAIETVAKLHYILGYEAEYMNEADTAREEYLKGYNIFRQLYDQELNQNMLLDMKNTLIALGKLAVKQNDMEEALAYFREALFQVQLNRLDDTCGFYDITLLIADTLEQLKRYEEAVDMYSSVKKFVEQYDENDFHRDLYRDQLKKAEEGLKRLTNN